MKRYFFILLLFQSYMNAQRIQNFNLVVTNTIVTARFTISAGSQCSGYNVLHSLDSLNYYPIYNYGGVCGNQNVAEDHKYDHYSPAFDVVNHYKIEIPGVEISPSQRVFVPSTPRVSMLLYPNPIYSSYDLLNIRIFNSPDQLYYGFLVSQTGRPLRELTLTTQKEMAQLPVFNLDDGIYVLWLTDGYKLYSSKFVVNRVGS